MQLINSITRQTDAGEEIFALVLRVAKKGRQPHAQTLVNTCHACVANDSQNIPLELFPLIGIALTSPLFMAVGYMLLIPLGFCVNYIRDPVKRRQLKWECYIYFPLLLLNDAWQSQHRCVKMLSTICSHYLRERAHTHTHIHMHAQNLVDIPLLQLIVISTGSYFGCMLIVLVSGLRCEPYINCTRMMTRWTSVV